MHILHSKWNPHDDDGTVDNLYVVDTRYHIETIENFLSDAHSIDPSIPMGFIFYIYLMYDVYGQQQPRTTVEKSNLSILQTGRK